jgi:hypothetical protein
MEDTKRGDVDRGRREAGTSAKGPYNFLFIPTDLERYFRPGELPMEQRRSRLSAARRSTS